MQEDMHTEHGDEKTLNRDEEKVRRILNLFFVLNATRRPIPTSQIIGDSDLGYGGDNRESEKKKFMRDRAELAHRGIIVREIKPEGASETEESSWDIDRDKTHVGSGILSWDDRCMLVDAIDELLLRNEIPYRAALERIRLKIAGLDESSNAHLPGEADPIYTAIWTALALKKKIKFHYQSPDGRQACRRCIAIYGVFTHAGHAYVVGEDQDKKAIRTFRVDRIERALKPSGSYTIPDGFDVRDHIFLPFDFGDGEKQMASFIFSKETSRKEIEGITRRRGELSQRDDGSILWSVEVRDIRSAASFALEHASTGISPCSPQSLISAWNDLIEKAVRAHEENL